MPNDQLNAIAEDVREIRKILDGAGEPEKGLVLRVDRLMQAESRRRWWITTAIACGLAGVFDAVQRHAFK